MSYGAKSIAIVFGDNVIVCLSIDSILYIIYIYKKKNKYAHSRVLKITLLITYIYTFVLDVARVCYLCPSLAPLLHGLFGVRVKTISTDVTGMMLHRRRTVEMISPD